MIVMVGMVAGLFIAPDVMTNIAVSTERSMANLEKKSLQLPTGEIVTYLESVQDPKNNKPTIVLLHGFGANKDNFTRFAKHLTDYHVIIPDLVGFGESTRRQGLNYASDAQAFRIRQFLIKKQATQSHLGGSSMGGHIALAYGAKYPEGVKSLLLLNTGGFWQVPATPLFKNFGHGKHPLQVQTKADYIKLYKLTMHKPPFVPTPMLGSMAKISIANQDIEKNIAGQLIKDDIEARAKKVKVPTLVVWGENDLLLSPDTANYIKKIMPHSKVIMMPETGHLPMIEQPKRVAEDYLAFLAQK